MAMASYHLPQSELTWYRHATCGPIRSVCTDTKVPPKPVYPGNEEVMLLTKICGIQLTIRPHLNRSQPSHHLCWQYLCQNYMFW